MPLSSNTLIHFTSDKNALKGILTDNFKLGYCKETITWAENSHWNIRVPMISFCDIPLSQIKDHIAKYGHYGIGLTREWAIKNKLNPVLYVQSGSYLAGSYRRLIYNIRKKVEVNDDNKPLIKSALDVGRYIKNYEGTLERKGKKFRKYRFSDEREWRYVPEFGDLKNDMFIEKSWSETSVANKAMESINDVRLKFTPKDVKYIIIKNDREISEFIDHLRSSKGKTYSQNQIEKLTTRIITSDQIHNDI